MARKKKQATPQPRVKGTIELHGRTYRARWMVDGKYYTRSTGTADRDKAEEKLAEFIEPFKLQDEKDTLALLAKKVEGVTAEIQAYEDAKPALALADGFEEYRRSTERPDTGEATLSMYESQYRRFVEWMAVHHPGAGEVRHVTRQMADEFMSGLALTFSANTYNKYATLFRRMWDVLAETARLTVNPWAKIKHKAEGKAATRRELTVDELRRVCESAKGEMRTLLAVGIYTGLRLGDCALLEWDRVDLARRMISVVPRKTARHANGRHVVIPIHAALAAMLSEIPPKARKGYVMPETAATYSADRAALTDKIQAAFKAVGIRTTTKAKGATRATVEVGFHSLRHTFVSLAANAGIPLAYVQSLVGHTSPAMTRHYFHQSEAALVSAVSALPAISIDGAQGAKKALPALPAATGTSAPTDGADAAEGRLSAFRAAFDALVTEEERERAREYVRRKAEIGPA